MSDPDQAEVTLGEVYRNLSKVETAVGSMNDALHDLRAEIMREVDVRLADRMSAMSDRVERLEKVIYGAVAAVLLAFLTSVAALVLRP